MAADGEVTFDPVSRSVLVKVSGFGASFWRRGHRAMMEQAGSYNEPVVWAHSPGRGQLSRGEAVRDNWLRFKLSDADYRQLAGEGASAVVVVDRGSGRIMGVRLGRSRSAF